MYRINKRNYKEYIEASRECTANRVYPMSIAAGVQSGDVYTNGKGSVMFWHYCGFAYLSGTVSPNLLEEVYQEFLMPDKGRRFLLITDSEYITDYYLNRNLLQFDKRIEYIQSRRTEKPSLSDDRFILERITAENMKDIQGIIVLPFSWESTDVFLKYGFWFLFRCNNSFAAVSFSSAVSSEEVDIGIETCEAYRHNGLASFFAYEMCEEILKRDKKPV